MYLVLHHERTTLLSLAKPKSQKRPYIMKENQTINVYPLLSLNFHNTATNRRNAINLLSPFTSYYIFMLAPKEKEKEHFAH